VRTVRLWQRLRIYADQPPLLEHAYSVLGETGFGVSARVLNRRIVARMQQDRFCVNAAGS
jgi:hypothetical protein